MKRITVNIFAAIGFCAICGVFLSYIFPLFHKSYLEQGLDKFGSKDGLIALVELYRKVDSEQNTEKPLKTFDGFPVTKRVPTDWIPEALVENDWDFGQKPSDGNMPWWGDVLAYYDANEKLIGIEFYGSRWGCFISEDPKVCPKHFESLHRIFSYPLYFSIRVGYSFRGNKPIQDMDIQEIIETINNWGSPDAPWNP
jgi:hypothetical protein